MLPQRRVWDAGSLRVELDMDWSGGPVVGIDGFSVVVRPGDIDALVAALLDAKEQVAAPPAETGKDA